MTIFRSRTARILAAGAGAVAVLAVSACGGETAAATTPSPEVRRALDTLVQAGFPGAQAVITTPAGEQTVTAGVGDVAAGTPIPDGAFVRIGSNTKTFVATVILQLVAEGKVELDAPVERYLPGVVRGNGNDGSRITVRQLLQHTSGLTDYLAGGDPSLRTDTGSPQLQPDTDTVRRQRYTPAELVAIAMSMPPQFEPGARAVYTNTNYILLGMLIEQVTGRPAVTEIGTRILEPLGLRDTYFPAPGETGLRAPHPHGYHETGGTRLDFTDLDPSWADTAGAMIATGADLNRFFIALLSGELLPAAQLDEMRRTVSFDRMPTAGYGLGLIERTASCGVRVTGHGGSIPGFGTHTGVTPDGRAVVLTVNELPDSAAQSELVDQAFDTIVCAS
ncbi:beta-lactamase family protein [Nocardia asteroides NBRC 15531]|uniref:Beta-lactamase n=1 Tax=Nocardia asteroides NBRC 15531 TaxID=1110697 RepID=U5EE51_NOCAS|nr:serine hydrolase domain-containing protein [Nocardia asteroides]TLF62200.1 beta-lactamase family protein [Nocardia asteroides NBRC 15531]UGT48203.1 beta-lactamase family protein [Nocardia asteroides]SFN72240.1 D-alanyl-D-alanine carboxypeptidase [Nocardia asteroides]VEG32757.1 D-alanyl-D-alanine carboxypeptidase precursor [Nocardia asteroides]GAD84688.1 putative beta-lactamase [Nocardia asteroides NBRC 15531]